MWRSDRVDPFLTVVPPQQTRQVIAQKASIAFTQQVREFLFDDSRTQLGLVRQPRHLNNRQQLLIDATQIIAICDSETQSQIVMPPDELRQNPTLRCPPWNRANHWPPLMMQAVVPKAASENRVFVAKQRNIYVPCTLHSRREKAPYTRPLPSPRIATPTPKPAAGSGTRKTAPSSIVRFCFMASLVRPLMPSPQTPGQPP